MRILFAIAALSLTLFAQEREIDRIAVVVNQQPITMGEWEQQERFEALTNSEPWNGVQRSHAALDRLIDRALILDQMPQAGVARADATATAAHLSAFRTQLKLEEDNAWRATLKRYGLKPMSRTSLPSRRTFFASWNCAFDRRSTSHPKMSAATTARSICPSSLGPRRRGPKLLPSTRCSSKSLRYSPSSG
jgi:hypothetical protein